MQAHTPLDCPELLKLLLDEDRLRVLGVLALQPGTARDVAGQLAMKEQLAARHIGRLWEAGLLKLVDSSRYALDVAAVHAWKRELFASPDLTPASTDAGTPDGRVLANFLDGEQLKSIPASQSKRLVVLAWLAEKFEPGVHYPEREVNAILQRHYADYASLRRYLVDAGLLQRESGIYHRSTSGAAAAGTPSGPRDERAPNDD